LRFFDWLSLCSTRGCIVSFRPKTAVVKTYSIPLRALMRLDSL